MSVEETGVIQAVPDTSDHVVQIDPELLQKPVHPSSDSEGSATEERFKAKTAIANSQARKAKDEAAALQRKVEKLEAEKVEWQKAEQAKVRRQMEDEGRTQELLEIERKERRDLQELYLSETADYQSRLKANEEAQATERLKSASLSAISDSNVHSPSQMYELLKSQLRTDDEGNPVVLNSGVEHPLSSYLANLRNSDEWAHNFTANGAQGMGSNPASPSVAPGMENPYKTGNVTARIRLEGDNPELAKLLKREAQRG